MQIPKLFRAINEAVTVEAARTLLGGCVLVDGEGALGRVMQEGYEVLRHLPAFTPPYPRMWLELGDITTDLDVKHYAGVIMVTDDIRTKGQRDKLYFPEPVTQKIADLGANVGWLVRLTIVVDTVPPIHGEYIGMMSMLLTDDGRLIGLNEGEPNRVDFGQMELNPNLINLNQIEQDYWNEQMGEPIDFEATVRDIVVDCSVAALMIVGMLHCKNIELDAPESSRKAQRKRERHGRTEERFYSLRVTGKGATAGTKVLGNPTGRQNAMHWCRGHFRTYTDDAPLMGKHTGTFWVEPHVRGNRGSGKVDKVYDVDVSMPLEANRETHS